MRSLSGHWGKENEGMEYPIDGDLLVARKALNVQVNEEDEVQHVIRINMQHQRIHCMF